MKKLVVIGTGRVGLPLLLAFASEGYDVTACDINEGTLQAIKNKRMPFEETGCQELLEKLDPIDTCGTDDIPKAEYYIITCGTPVRQHFEADFNAVTEAIGNLVDYDLLQPNITLILRSTLAPGTTDYIKKFLKAQNVHCKIAMCPERLAEGKALKELYKLPQIIGAYDDDSFESAKSLFECFGTEALRVLPKEAELCKLLCNTYRYINFAIPNYFMYVLNSFGIENPLEVIQKAAKDYPRMAGLTGPGPCAGTCVPGNRIVKVYDKSKSKISFVEFKKLYEYFSDECELYTDSYNSTITEKNSKKVENVTCNNFTGKMITFNLENGEQFICTDYHWTPVKRDGKLQIVHAIDVLETDEFFLNN